MRHLLFNLRLIMAIDNPTHGVLLINLGSPDAATTDAVAKWLVEFLSDPDVVELPRCLWLPLLKNIIVPRRAPHLAELYSTIWTDQGSPLTAITRRQAAALETRLIKRGYQVQVAAAMRYGSPDLMTMLTQFRRKYRTTQVMLQYPQFAQSTSGSCLRVMSSVDTSGTNIINSYPTEPAYIAALCHQIKQYWQTHGRGDHLLISYHGLPERTVRRGDPYQQQCEQTTVALVDSLELNPDEYTLCYQSRFGAGRWIGPASAKTATDLAAIGVERLDVICPGFSADCLETLEEISVQLRDQFMAAGGKAFHYIPALNDSPAWINAMADMLEPGIQEQTDD